MIDNQALEVESFIEEINDETAELFSGSIGSNACGVYRPPASRRRRPYGGFRQPGRGRYDDSIGITATEPGETFTCTLDPDTGKATSCTSTLPQY